MGQFEGGPEQVHKNVGVVLDTNQIAEQKMTLCDDRTAFRVTTFEESRDGDELDLMPLLLRTNLEAIQWINISRAELTFKTLRKD